VPERLFPSFRRKCNRSATACSVAPVCGEFQICRIDPSGFQVLSRLC
jgi:hypothetical protein